MIKVESVLVIIGCIQTGICADDNVLCRLMDFNRTDSISNFEECTPIGSTGLFSIKSYLDKPLPTYGEDYENYLTNVQPGWACFSLIELFTLNVNTKFSTAIYLQSSVIADNSYVEIQLIDLDGGGSVFPLINAAVSYTSEWKDYDRQFERSVINAKIEIRTYVTIEAQLAIQYFRISNSEVEESECERATDATTEEITTEELTTEELTTEKATTEEATTEEEITEEPTTEEATTEEATTEEITTEEITTEEATTEEVTTEGATTEGATTEEATTEKITTEVTVDTTSSSTTTTSPPESNERNVWIITSFVFFLTTIMVSAGFMYLIYLYKTTLAMKNTLLSAVTTQHTHTNKSLPRLTVATSSEGHQVIVGIENGKRF